MRKSSLSIILSLTISAVFGQYDFSKEYRKIDSLIESNNISRLTTLKTIEQSIDSFQIKNLEKKLDSIAATTDYYKKELLLTDFRFIRTNNNSLKSLDLLTSKIWTQAAENLSDSFLVLFEIIDEQIQRSAQGLKAKVLLSNFKNSLTGGQISNIIFKDIHGKIFSTDSLMANKLILLDYWASWCVYCREDFPFIKSNIDTSKVTIIAISRDEDLEKRNKAIKQDKIDSWIHVDYEYSKIFLENFFVWAIPVKVLINKQGKIIGRWRGGGEENKRHVQEMIEQNL